MLEEAEESSCAVPSREEVLFFFFFLKTGNRKEGFEEGEALLWALCAVLKKKQTKNTP